MQQQQQQKQQIHNTNINIKCNKMKELWEDWVQTLEINTKNIYEELFMYQANLRIERNKFFSATQEKDETFPSFVSRLRDLGRNCHFNNYSNEDAIIDQVIIHTSEPIKKLLLSEQDLSVYKALAIVMTTESSTKQDKQILDKVEKAPENQNNIILFDEESAKSPRAEDETTATLLYDADAYKLELLKNKRNSIYLFEGEG